MAMNARVARRETEEKKTHFAYRNQFLFLFAFQLLLLFCIVTAGKSDSFLTNYSLNRFIQSHDKLIHRKKSEEKEKNKHSDEVTIRMACLPHAAPKRKIKSRETRLSKMEEKKSFVCAEQAHAFVIFFETILRRSSNHFVCILFLFFFGRCSLKIHLWTANGNRERERD